MASLLSTLQERTYELLSRLEEKGEGEEEERKKLVRDFLKEDNLQRVGFELPPLGKDWTWFNVDSPLTVEGHFVGRLVVLDFFTYCCVNCLHVLPDLRRLEASHPAQEGELIVVGVHSAKFDNEKADGSIASACRRHGIRHPVVNDSGADWWRELGVCCWPTILVLDPTATPVAVFLGEGHGRDLHTFIEVALDVYSEQIDQFKSRKQTIPLSLEPGSRAGFLRFPGKVSVSPDGRLLLVSDSGNHRVLVCDASDGGVVDVVGSGRSGFRDGRFDSCEFGSPQGLCVHRGASVFVADPENHSVRVADLERKTVETVCGNGKQGKDLEGGAKGKEQAISSPWDVCLGNSPGACQGGRSDFDTLYISMAGSHQIWALALEDSTWWRGKRRERGQCFAVAGSGKEENRNNSYPSKSGFAQPSGLSWDDASHRLFVADSESSSVRMVDIKNGGAVKAVCGGERDPTNLFSYGDVDGVGVEAKLQHPLGVAVGKEGIVFVADSYNHKIKKISPDGKTFRCSALAGNGGTGGDGEDDDDEVDAEAARFSEPGGLDFDPASDALFVADTNNHCVRRIQLGEGNRTYRVHVGAGGDMVDSNRTEKEEEKNSLSCTVAPGAVELEVRPSPPLAMNAEAPSSWKLLAGQGSRGVSSKEGDRGRLDRKGSTALVLEGEGTLEVEVTAYLCNKESGMCTVRRILVDLTVSARSGVKGGKVKLNITEDSVTLGS